WVQDSWNVTPGFFILGWNLVAPPIAITSVSPSQVCTATIEDTDVTLIGQYFNGATTVNLNGVSTPFTVVSDTEIIVHLTSASTSGVFEVISDASSGQSTLALTVNENPEVA